MRVAVMGAGGVGGVLGARLQADGHDVHFIARGAHRTALADDGLRLESPNGDLHLKPVGVASDPASVGICDVVVFAVKMPDAVGAARGLAPLIGPRTLVVPYLNGVEAADMLVGVLGPDPVAGGVVYISATIERPGVIRQTGAFQKFVHGELDGRHSDRLEAWHSALTAAGIESVVSDTIRREIWRKFVLLAAHSGVTSVTRGTIGQVRDHPETLALLRQAVIESARVAAAHGIGLPDDIIDRQMAFMHTMPAAMKSSMQMDLDRGKPLELAWLSGAVVRLGATKGVDTPAHRFICAALALHADGTD